MNDSEKLELGGETNKTANSKPSAANNKVESPVKNSDSKDIGSKKSFGATLLTEYASKSSVDQTEEILETTATKLPQSENLASPNNAAKTNLESLTEAKALKPQACDLNNQALIQTKPQSGENSKVAADPKESTKEAKAVNKPKPSAAAKPTAKAQAKNLPKAQPKALPKKTSEGGKGGSPAKVTKLDGQEPLYLPKPASKANSVDLKRGANIVLLPYISVIFSQNGWQGLAQGLRKELWSKSFARRLVMGTVIIPGIIIFFYLLFWASPSYISEAKFAVRGQNNSTALEGLSSLFSFSSSTQNDSYIVLNYIMSLDMFSKLDKSLHLKEHYTDKKYDLWYRLWQNPTQDDIINFWQWACEAKYDPDTSILEVQVKAFTPEKALAICEGILKSSEQLVNDMNLRSRKDAISKAEAEVNRAEDRIRKARKALQNYREKTVILDPEAVATGLYGVVNKLEADVTRTAAELSEAMTYMNKDSPRVKQLENRLTVLQKQLAQEKKRLAGKVKGNESLSSLLSEFQNLSLEEEFAQKQLTSAMTSLEAARIQADAQTQYVEAFERPVLADQSLYPRPALFALLYMVTTLLILGLVSLIVAAIREHAGF